MKVVATGGLGSLIGTGSKYIKTVDDFLTLEGLRIIWERNATARRETAGKPTSKAPLKEQNGSGSRILSSSRSNHYAVVENYFNYFTEIEEHFLRQRMGRPAR